VVSVLA
jgi:NADPH:quinone reductase-like Zn-dependent oxidoreductase